MLHWFRRCRDFDHLNDQFVLRTHFYANDNSETVDYFRPRGANVTVCDVVTSHTLHRWAPSMREVFQTPLYSAANFGGTCMPPLLRCYVRATPLTPVTRLASRR